MSKKKKNNITQIIQTPKKKIVKGAKQYFINNPMAAEIHSKKLKQYHKDNPEFGKKQSKRLKNKRGIESSRYKHSVTNQSIIDLIIRKTIEKGKKLTELNEWRENR